MPLDEFNDDLMRARRTDAAPPEGAGQGRLALLALAAVIAAGSVGLVLVQLFPEA